MKAGVRENAVYTLFAGKGEGSGSSESGCGIGGTCSSAARSGTEAALEARDLHRTCVNGRRRGVRLASAPCADWQKRRLALREKNDARCKKGDRKRPNRSGRSSRRRVQI